jgi:HAD superfamily hydrolase (TIGR01450 family)
MSQKPPKDLAGFIFDVDGCVARGTQALPGVPDTLAHLRARGIRCAFMTNENMSTRSQVVAKLVAMGIPCTAEDVVTAAMVAAEVTRALHPGQKVLAVGAAGLVEALHQCGVTVVDAHHATEATVVVMGKDPNFDMTLLDVVCQAIWRGAAFIATNLDPKVPTATGFSPAAGAMIKAVAYATSHEPLVTGKPSQWAAAMAVRALGLAPDRSAVVGDQLEQDITMGKQAGLFTIAVLTGATTAEAAAAAPEAVRPDVILPDVNHLPAWLESLGG